MLNLAGHWKIDNIDLWTGFKTAILTGTADFLKYAPKKEALAYDWKDESGLDVDLSAPRYAARIATLNCFIRGENTADFFENYKALIGQLMLPGVHTLTINAHGPKAYGVEYMETGDYRPNVSLKREGSSYNVHTFTLTLRELNPDPGAYVSRIVDDAGRVLTS